MEKSNKNARQQMRINDIELGALKSVFAENDDVIYAARKAMFLMDLDADDIKILKVFSAPDIQAVMSSILMPTISAEIPLGQNIDLWMSIKDIKEMDEWHTGSEIEGRLKLVEFIKRGLANLANPSKKGSPDVVDYKPVVIMSELSRVLSDMIARNTYITHVEQQLNQIRALAGMKKETVEETKARLAKNSSK